MSIDVLITLLTESINRLADATAKLAQANPGERAALAPTPFEASVAGVKAGAAAKPEPKTEPAAEEAAAEAPEIPYSEVSKAVLAAVQLAGKPAVIAVFASLKVANAKELKPDQYAKAIKLFEALPASQAA
jgi:hypothetical protein